MMTSPFVRHTTEVPELRKLGQGHLVACHWAEEIKAGQIQPHEAESAPESA